MKRHGVTKCGKGWRVDRYEARNDTTVFIGFYLNKNEADAAMEGNGGHARPVKEVGVFEPAVVLEPKK